MGKSEATGDRLEEAKHINRSLSALGDVMAALANKERHVPFRNSKLTQLLQDSLQGQAKAMMFIHISPEVGFLAVYRGLSCATFSSFSKHGSRCISGADSTSSWRQFCMKSFLSSFFTFPQTRTSCTLALPGW